MKILLEQMTHLPKKYRHPLAAISIGLFLCAAYSHGAQAAGQWFYECTQPRRVSSCYQSYREGLAALRTGSKDENHPLWGYLDKSGKMAIKPAYDRVQPFSNGVAAVRQGDSWGYIDTQGTWVLSPRFAEATAFNRQGTAVVQAGELIELIDRQGHAVKTFPLGTRLGLDGFTPGNALAPLQVPVPPMLWNLRTGRQVRLPQDVMDVGTPQNGWIPAQRRLSVFRGQWGYLNGNAQWIVKPDVLQSQASPISDHSLIAVQRDDQWMLVDLTGKVLSSQGYANVQLLDRGSWLVTTPGRHAQILDKQAHVVLDLGAEGQVNAQHLGAWTVAKNKEAVFLIGADAQIKKFDVTSPDISFNGDYLWIRAMPEGAFLSAQDDAPLSQIVDAGGHALLDSETRQALTEYSAYPIVYNQTPPGGTAGQIPIANLLPADYHNNSAILTPAGKIVTNAQWGIVRGEQDAQAPVIVEAKDERRGAIDAQGNWAIKPTFYRLKSFAGPYTMGVEGPLPNLRRVVVDQQGREAGVPARIAEHAQSISGALLTFSSQDKHGQERWGVWDIKQGSMLVKRDMQQIKAFHGSYALAQQDDKWGVLDRRGHWAITPQFSDMGPPELLDEGLYLTSITRPLWPGAEQTTLYRLISAAAGKEIAGPLLEKPVRLAKGRFLVQPLSGGSEVVDRRGKKWIGFDGRLQAREVSGDWLALHFEDAYGAIDGEGAWRVPPVYDSALSFVQPEGLARAYTGSAYVLLNEQGKVLPEPVGDAAPVAGMQRLVYNDDADNETILADLQGEEVARLKGQFAIEQDGAANGLAVYGEDGKYGFIDEQGKRVIGAYFDQLGPMQDGRAYAVRMQQGGEAYGFIDDSGRFVIRPEYQWVTSFSEGRALVMGGDGPRFIDTEGGTVARFVERCGQVAVLDKNAQQVWPEQDLTCDSGQDAG